MQMAWKWKGNKEKGRGRLLGTPLTLNFLSADTIETEASLLPNGNFEGQVWNQRIFFVLRGSNSVSLLSYGTSKVTFCLSDSKVGNSTLKHGTMVCTIRVISIIWWLCVKRPWAFLISLHSPSHPVRWMFLDQFTDSSMERPKRWSNFSRSCTSKFWVIIQMLAHESMFSEESALNHEPQFQQPCWTFPVTPLSCWWHRLNVQDSETKLTQRKTNEWKKKEKVG